MQAKTGKSAADKIRYLEREYSAKEVQGVLRTLTGNSEKIGLALLNYYSRTDLVCPSGQTRQRGRAKYSYADIVLLSWLFRLKQQGLAVNRFRRGIAYLRKRLPKLHQNPKDMMLITDGEQLFLKHRVDDREGILEVLTGEWAGQYRWAYPIGTLIEEVDQAIEASAKKAA
ncbi:MAG TPA: hypothetical protein PKA63_02010 [Oligoflexia bacterium]|nr:hypothetical protein [Oligoflexia bacterium]HMP47425.1 hypothetical protein [Oligoflexia bacterium]